MGGRSVFARRYNSHADAITSERSQHDLDSNNHTLWTSVVGTTEHAIPSTVTAHPDTALIRRPAFHALPNIYRYGKNPVITMSDFAR